MIEKKEVEFAKQLDDVMKLASKAVTTIKKKESVAVLVPELIKAIDGIGELKSEFANKKAFIMTLAEGLYDIVDSFVPEKVIEAPVAATEEATV